MPNGTRLASSNGPSAYHCPHAGAVSPRPVCRVGRFDNAPMHGLLAGHRGHRSLDGRRLLLIGDTQQRCAVQIRDAAGRWQHHRGNFNESGHWGAMTA
jgi:hypothetical protein